MLLFKLSQPLILAQPKRQAAPAGRTLMATHRMSCRGGDRCSSGVRARITNDNYQINNPNSRTQTTRDEQAQASSAFSPPRHYKCGTKCTGSLPLWPLWEPPPARASALTATHSSIYRKQRPLLYLRWLKVPTVGGPAPFGGRLCTRFKRTSCKRGTWPP